MEENFNNEEMNTENQEQVEVLTGPSKGFIGLATGGAVAIIAGIIVMVKRHKKKKADAQSQDDFEFESDPVEISEEEGSEES